MGKKCSQGISKPGMCPVLGARDKRAWDKAHSSSSGSCAWLAGLTVGSWAALEAKLKQNSNTGLVLGWGRDVLVWVWMFHLMHVLLPATFPLVLARVWFHVMTNLFYKMPMLTNVQWLLELMDLKCLYFPSSCLYQLISVAINSMGLWNLVHAGSSRLRNLYFPWHCSLFFMQNALHSLLPSHVCFTRLFWFFSFICSIRVKFLGLCFSGNLENS